MTLSWKKKAPSSAKVQARSPAALFSENQEGVPAPLASSAPRLPAGLGGRSSVGPSPQPSTLRAHFHLCGLCPASSTHSGIFSVTTVPPTPARKRGLPGWEGRSRLSLQVPDASFIPAAESLLLHAGFVQLWRGQGSSLDADCSLRWLLLLQSKGSRARGRP